MSSYEGSYKSLLQGVSQQIPRMRLPGQVSAQDNMLSDIVTGPRRRPGAEYRYHLSMPGATTDSILAWDTDIANQRVNIILDTNSGTVKVLNEAYVEQATLQSNYLKAPRTQDIRATTVGSEFFLLNTTVAPVSVAPPTTVIPPTRRGFFFIVTGTFNKPYDITVQTNAGSVTGNYTTPAGLTAGDAVNATPDVIATNLVNSLNTNGLLSTLKVTATRIGAYVYFQGDATVTSLVVASNAGTTYVTPSSASKVRLEGNLPAKLPDVADGYIVAVGQQKLLTYYKYDKATISWLEAGAFDSPASITGMPVSVTYNGTWVIDNSAFEGRLAGDEETNPLPKFLKQGLSGMGAFQGRLVLLSGPEVYLSSSTVPRRFMRSTVTGLLDADAIAVGASANSSASYQYAVPFQKDLLLFSSKYQALIPSTGAAITPRNATVVLTSTLSMDITSQPVPVGRTLLFAAPRSTDFFGLTEMISSQYTDSQYVSNPATDHLPKYMGGTCRFGVSSTVASMVLFGPSRDKRALIAYEYAWSGDEKVQQSWHKWNFGYEIAATYFSGEAINLLFVKNGHIVGARIDPRVGVLSFSVSRRPYLDIYFDLNVVNNKATLPAWVLAFDPDFGTRMKLSQNVGDLAGEEVGIESYDKATGVVTTVRSYPTGVVSAGIPYRSTFSPTPPVIEDQNGVKIDSAKLTLLRFGLSTQNSSEYQVVVHDEAQEATETLTQGTLRFCSAELDIGRARYGLQSRAIVPARTNADSTSLSLYTVGTGEMNFVGIDYVARFNQKIRRR